MPGPLPKNPGTRQRRNKQSTAVALPPECVNALPECVNASLDFSDTDWLPQTLAWWEDVLASPMSTQYREADMHALLRLAVLIDLFWIKPTVPLAAEIRQEESRFGLTPLDRMRLQWKIEDEVPKLQQEYEVPAEDPRRSLRIIGE